MAGTKSIITDYINICFFCGKPAEGEHHLLFGNGTRKLAEEDGLKVSHMQPVPYTWHSNRAHT